MAATTRANLRTRIARRLGGYISSTASAVGTTTTLVDTATIHPDNTFVNRYIQFDSGALSALVRLITDWVQATGTYTFSPATATAPASAISYSVWPINITDLDADIDEAVRMADAWHSVVISEATAGVATELRYILPDACLKVLKVYSFNSSATPDTRTPLKATLHGMGQTGKQYLQLWESLNTSVYLGYEYTSRVTLAAAATSELILGEATKGGRYDDACAAFIVEYALYLLHQRRYRASSDEMDWNSWRASYEAAERIKLRQGMPPPAEFLSEQPQPDEFVSVRGDSLPRKSPIYTGTVQL